jgi:hypothetical protein
MVRRRLDLKIFLSIAAAFFVVGCELTEEDKNKVGDLFEPPVAEPWPEEEPLCFRSHFVLATVSSSQKPKSRKKSTCYL